MSGVSVAQPDLTLPLNDHGGICAANLPDGSAGAAVRAGLVVVQQAAEREHWRLRDIETRHRLLFDVSSEAMLAVGGADFRVIEVNPAATRALGVVEGSVLAAALAPREQASFTAFLDRVRAFGGAPGIVLHFGPERAAWAIRASLITIGEETEYVLHVTPAGLRPAPLETAPLPLDALMERLPDGFVIANGDGSILQANRAFLDLVQVAAVGAVQGHALGRWMTEPGADAAVLLGIVRRHGSVRSFQTVLHGELGAEVAVEVSAAGYAGTGVESFGIALRDVGRRRTPPCDFGGERSRAVVDTGAQQLGVAPLSQVVRSAVDTIERSMIAAALARVDGNRTAAAELLGVSRQSLHNKLNRHAAENGSAGVPEAGTF